MTPAERKIMERVRTINLSDIYQRLNAGNRRPKMATSLKTRRSR